MQSANHGDLGWREMMNHGDKMSLMVPPNLRSAVGSPALSPSDNIAASVSHLLYRAAEFGPQTQMDKNDIKSVVVSHSDSLTSIARKLGTTEHVLRDMNPHTPLSRSRSGPSSTIHRQRW